MNTKHNFGAGPCVLPASVLQQAANAVLNWNNLGLSILEVSHRSSDFENVISKTELLVRELLQVPDHYSILFMQGGASTQFSMLPMNFLKGRGKACYLDTGFFAQKAIREALLFGEVNIVNSSADKAYSYIPEDYLVDKDAAYLHCTSNNTIEGTEMFQFPHTSIPLVCDMSSDIFSRVINVEDFDLIYAGAQKNMGPAGMTLVIVKDEFLGRKDQVLPAMSDYRIFKEHGSLYNTPPVFSIYVAMLNMTWLKDQGGVAAIEQRNIEKAEMLYTEIDRNSLFYGMAQGKHRSRMNVTFRMYNQQQESSFLDFVKQYGIVGIRGYRTVGGFRASLYNALSIESVIELVKAMRDFEHIYVNLDALHVNSANNG